ncbi:hypothetical protein [Flagellimonas sp.]|uniref:hypothetical protein n=1 Tax=Flagellimonas sp. TaxID=2058762 RepID=UPI003F49D8BB
MENYEFLHLLSGFISTIFQLVVIVGCILLLSKSRNLATVLMLVGSVLSLFFSLFSVLGTSFMASQGAENLVQGIAIMGVVGQIPHILFALGLLLYVIKHVKKELPSKNI